MHKLFGVFVIAFIVLLVASIGISIYLPIATKENVTITVVDKERIVESGTDSVSSKYLIFTEDEVFENTDSLLVFKFNSSDIQGKLKIGETYQVRVYGWRVPIFSMYRNIIEIEK